MRARPSNGAAHGPRPDARGAAGHRASVACYHGEDPRSGIESTSSPRHRAAWTRDRGYIAVAHNPAAGNRAVPTGVWPMIRLMSGPDVGIPMRTSVAFLLLGMALAGCSPVTPTSTPAAVASPIGKNATPSPSASIIATGTDVATASPLTIADAESCPVTKPGKAPAEIGDRLFGAALAFGNTGLWVGGLGPDGVIAADSRFVESDESIGWKFGWWRIVPGTLMITGRRLDAPAPPLRASVPDGYGPHGFQASGVYFSTEGCWEVSGTVGSSKLTFVTFVLRT